MTAFTFRNSTAAMFIPDSSPEPGALLRTTHLGIGAHQDDLEIMAFHGIGFCYRDPHHWFGGIICSEGGGSARSGKYADYSDCEMSQLRKKEQEVAASLGKYSFVAQLDYPSPVIKDPAKGLLTDELKRLIERVRPEVVYTHNRADKHETHVGTFVAVINALRGLPKNERPGTVYGCEVWRDLDWMLDDDKVVLDVTGHNDLGQRLIGVFDSQIMGGKRYDLAASGRWYANATYYRPHETDEAAQLLFAMDLSPLVADESLDVEEYVMGYVDRFKNDVKGNLNRFLKPATGAGKDKK